MDEPAVLGLLAVLLVAVGFVLMLRWGMQWGSTPSERSAEMPGDHLLDGGASRRVAMTRAISIEAEPSVVWPWLAQIGRGAGWYSYDLLDNGGRTSAEHIVSWIPEPALGDASPIGYLRELEAGRSLVWWVRGLRFGGCFARLVVDMALTPRGQASRVVIRISADARGATAPLALLVFRVIDSVMARRQLLGLRARAERFGARAGNPEEPETGSRHQYQLYEVIYASGERAGVLGKEQAERWRRAAIEDDVLAGGASARP